MRKFSAFLKEERSQMPQQMQRKVFGESNYCGIQEMLAFKFKVNLDFHHHFFQFFIKVLVFQHNCHFPYVPNTSYTKNTVMKIFRAEFIISKL